MSYAHAVWQLIDGWSDVTERMQLSKSYWITNAVSKFSPDIAREGASVFHLIAVVGSGCGIDKRLAL